MVVKRYFFEISYDGTRYHGWQRQENASSVQQTVEEALSTILRRETSIVGSGRTDTGVHCEQQYFHVDFEESVEVEGLEYKLNSLLPKDISIGGIQEVQADGHTRFSAVSRSYQYRLNTLKNPFLVGYCYYFTPPLDVDMMNEASKYLLGEQDFKSFSKVKTEVNNFKCDISHAGWNSVQNKIYFDITANRFLRGMVRAIVGTLLQVGQGQLSVKDFEQVIIAKNRKKAGPSAPAQGLFLTSVTYPKSIFKG